MRKIIFIITTILGVLLGLTACSGAPTNNGGVVAAEPHNVSEKSSVTCADRDAVVKGMEKVGSNAGSLASKADPGKLRGEWGIPDAAAFDARLREIREMVCLGTSSSTPATSVTAKASDCPQGSPLTYDPNKDLNVVSGGVQNTREDLAAIRKDPRNLAYRANNLGFWANAHDWKALVSNDGKCLSAEGEKLFAKVEGALTASSTKTDEHAQAPAGMYNTGMNAQGPVVNPTPGIDGNLAAITYTLKDGTKVIVLKRCGNLALPGKPPAYPERPVPGSKPAPPAPPVPGPPPVVPPNGGGNPPPVVPPVVPPAPKVPSPAPGQGGAGDGGASVYGGPGTERQTAAPAPSAPAAGPPPAVYVPPVAPVAPAPAPTPPAVQVPAPAATPAPQPTVAPSSQPVNHGTVPTAAGQGCNNPEFCG
jgi:hypothetical protein